MDIPKVLADFDDQTRRNPAPEHGAIVEHDAHVTRIVAPTGLWRGVIWSDLNEDNADSVIDEQIRRLAPDGQWEWKVYSYDRPAALPDVEFAPVVDTSGVDALVSVHNEVFGGRDDFIRTSVLAGPGVDPPTVAAVVAFADGRPISAGRVEFPEGREFASIWGGGTLPAWRRRGVFRALVARRAALAAARGYRYLQVDASPDSKPILKRLGFHEVTTTAPHRWT